MPVFPGITQLDLTGPHEVLSRVPGVEIDLVWKTLEPIRAQGTGRPGLILTPTATFESCQRTDMLCVPGGSGCIDILNDDEVLAAIARLGSSARYVTSVCTGSLILGAAGLLTGYRATCHWASLPTLETFGATPVAERVVIDRNRITGAGVTSGLDFSLQVISQLWGSRMAEMAQLSLEYDPAPPFDAGSPRVARPELVDAMRAAMRPLNEKRDAAIERAAAKLRRPR
jgi:cyclohexyl-isocyanide hydratase